MIEKNLQKVFISTLQQCSADGTMTGICKILDIKRLENILNISNPNLLRGKHLNLKKKIFIRHAVQNGRISKERVAG